MSKPTLEDVQTHIMNHVQDLTKLEHQLVGIKRQVLTTYHALGEILTEQYPNVDLPATNSLPTMRAGLREGNEDGSSE